MQVGLLPHRGDLAHRLTTVGEHHRQVEQHLPRVMPATAGPDPSAAIAYSARSPVPLGQPITKDSG